ncbi:hypothetical protein E6W39_02445 [Kitasatospora acidiphila]|uniref:Phosphatidylinositol diacylglycerol-lyase n=1 Tax=Kitasatospora acidiphila TaxID=2567942 RepID=A0A540VYW6_9ACTN|nr:hypothetical protein [Kitasatospora acidiphila]TQF01304.1 hypothetical protein E6W39_02445 [Kitasatospora acidiphila]
MDLTGPQLSRRTFTRSAVVLGAAGALAGLGALGTARAASLPGGADWLAALPDSAPLARLTIPGTHDTCALYDGPLVQCQNLSVPDQLTAGIRFLDMRCRAINGVFAIHHSQFFQISRDWRFLPGQRPGARFGVSKVSASLRGVRTDHGNHQARPRHGHLLQGVRAP